MADQRAYNLALRKFIMVSLLDQIVSALQKLNSDEVPLDGEIAALQQQVSQFEADVQAQAEAAVSAALNTSGVSAAQLQALADRVTALEAADSALNAALPTPAPVVEPTPVPIEPAPIPEPVEVDPSVALPVGPETPVETPPEEPTAS